MKKIVIIKTGDSIPSLVKRRDDFENWIINKMECNNVSVQIISVHKDEIPPDFDLIGGIVITGSHEPVTDRADWSERTAAWLVGAIKQNIPILGICFGHQILAHALGGRVGSTLAGPEFGTVSASLTPAAKDDMIFRDLPPIIQVQASHYQSALDLPSGSTILAFSKKEPHAAVRFRPNVWGVQFHPEFDADITSTYIREFYAALEESTDDLSALLDNCKDTRTGSLILRRFKKVIDQI
jgi:GMP synthase (glutamine-hydrolysing)